MLNSFFIFLIRLYQKFVSPLYGRVCRFYPSCSEYAILCLNRYPIYLAIVLIILRIIRCQPLFPGGYDPPEKVAEKLKWMR
ncbi:MAG: membrane protein insertion efficiency factor YidD [candidate division WOR-3 bacterium]|nr:membrane protein insertion efficiency factor YidD [candidate division WOR-3 bacterium]MCX7836992.1 membrane protein insertion efficiency factor YidD [candidate division WOR-3 bacterium]MDW8114070.1 membrane protein insertion efficiency factor YidD [candidate division WOR-3 bacterium]